MPGIPRELGCNFSTIRPFPDKKRGGGRSWPAASSAIGRCCKLAKRAEFEQTKGMSLVRTMYAIMASRKPVMLSDGRTGVITRVDTSFPQEETTVEVWVKAADGPGLAKVNAKSIVEASSAKKTA